MLCFIKFLIFIIYFSHLFTLLDLLFIVVKFIQIVIYFLKSFFYIFEFFFFSLTIYLHYRKKYVDHCHFMIYIFIFHVLLFMCCFFVRIKQIFIHAGFELSSHQFPKKETIEKLKIPHTGSSIIQWKNCK